MKRLIKVLFVSMLILVVIPVSAQTAIETVPLPVGEKIAVDLGDSILYLDRVAYTPTGETPTPTSVPPTPTVPSTGSEPNINAPYCEDIGLEHNNHAWHPHWNAEAGCFWNEFHGDDPNSPEMVAIFGAIEQPVFGGPQSSSEVEHIVKHRGDVVFAARRGDPNWIPFGEYSVADQFQNRSVNDSVEAYRIVAHADDAFPGFLFTIHGYKAEFYVCTQESGFNDCGIVRVKGHAFFDEFRVPFYTFPPKLRPGCDADTRDCDFGYGYELSYPADDPNDQKKTGEPYVQMQHPLTQTLPGGTTIDWMSRLRGNQSIENKVSWSMNEIGPCNESIDECVNRYVRFAFQSFDAGTLPKVGDLNNSPQICFGESHCAYDNSYKGIFEVQAWIPDSFKNFEHIQANGNSITGYVWVDRFQNPKDNQNSCSEEMLGSTIAGDCFKMEFEHYPISPGAATNRRGPGNLTYYLTEYNECLPDKNCKVR